MGCTRCGAETKLFVKGVPLCLKCDEPEPRSPMAGWKIIAERILNRAPALEQNFSGHCPMKQPALTVPDL